ncbi:glycosyltransferase [Bacillus daqingensis]|uniref:Glycosyltransferase n=1 Tax=Bacillus daqingensis TaxID=872396 RepID=A0ABV9NWR7_9BACI
MRHTVKVLHMTTLHHPLDPRIYYKQCASLKRAGYDVTLLAPVPTNTEEGEVPFEPLPKYSNRWKGLLFGTVRAYFRAKKQKADIYHIHDPELLPVGWLLKNKRNHVIYDIHEDYETGIVQRQYFTRPVRQLIASVYKKVEAFCTRRMELILAEKYYLEKYPQGLCVLNYPILQEKLTGIDRSFHQADGLLYTGNVTKDRGAVQHAALPALDESLQVHLYGYCPESLAAEMKQRAGTHEGRLHLHGEGRYVPKAEIDAAYAQSGWLAGIALFPPSEHYMKKELTKFFEYMAAGLPVICSDYPKWQTFMDTYQCGICVNPDSEGDIRDAINYLRQNPEEAKTMGERGRKAVQNYLNWGHEEKKLTNLYDRLNGIEAGEYSDN